MLKYVVLWIVLGFIAEIGAGMYVGYYEDKCGITDPDEFNLYERIGEYVEKKKSIYYRFLNMMPSGLDILIDTVLSALFWPIHALWLVTVSIHIYDDYVKTRMTNEP